MNRQAVVWRITGVVAATLAMAVTAGPVSAEPSADDKALATLLFQEGRAALAADNLAEACPKLAESQRLDPGGGTLLNLALCHEQEGRLAHSWSEFKEAAGVARRDGRHDREMEATNHVAALEPRLSRLVIVVPPSSRIEGLLVERDGHEVGPGAWSLAIPVDGGPHTIRATALGREPFTTTVILAAEGDSHRVEIPVLATPVVVVAPSRVEARADAAAPPTGAPLFRPARLRTIGIVSGATGVVLLGVAGWALASALHLQSDSKSDCFPDGCGDRGLQQREDAVSRGTWATALGVGGAVLIAAGALSYYFGRRAEPPGRTAALLPEPLTVGVTSDGIVMQLAGRL
jgi:hypothetical protein